MKKLYTVAVERRSVTVIEVSASSVTEAESLAKADKGREVSYLAGNPVVLASTENA